MATLKPGDALPPLADEKRTNPRRRSQMEEFEELIGHSLSSTKHEDANDGAPPPTYNGQHPAFRQKFVDTVAITRDFLTESTNDVYRYIGHSRNPDCEIVRSDGIRILDIETDSTLVYHESSVAKTNGGQLFFLKRKNIDPDGNVREYFADTPGRNGKRIFEMETGPRMLSPGQSSRLAFRNVDNGRLEAVELHIGSGSSKMADVTYAGQKIGEIVSRGSISSPEFELRVMAPRVDVLLLVILTMIMDDRTMEKKRRLRSSRLRGLAGIGKGPGAGLAGAYAIGSII